MNLKFVNSGAKDKASRVIRPAGRKATPSHEDSYN